MHDSENVAMTKRKKLELIKRDKEKELLFAPTKEQAKTFAYLITPEIKKYFADEQVQKDFANWQEKRDSA